MAKKKRLSFQQLRMLRSLAAGDSYLADVPSGQSFYGGASGTVASLIRLGLARYGDDGVEITEAGRAELTSDSRADGEEGEAVGV